jgi:hypothetical protein
MLTDAEIASMSGEENYRKLVRLGLKQFVDDVLDSGAGDLKPSISDVLKFVSKLWRARTVKMELAGCTQALIERIANRDLKWPRTPDSVRSICDAHEAGYKWMRYDEPRVTALFRRCGSLFTDAQFREILKRHSTLPEDQKNQRLLELRSEIETLEDKVVLSIRTRGIFDGLTDLNADIFYKEHEEEIQRRFLEGTRGGRLGLPGSHEQH